MTAVRVATRAQRIAALLEHLGVQRAHFATRPPLNVSDLVASRPDLVASVALVLPGQVDYQSFSGHNAKILCLHGDSGPGARVDHSQFHNLDHVSTGTLIGHVDASWSDSAAEMSKELGDLVSDFLTRVGRGEVLPAMDIGATAGEVGGISYRTRGKGPPLVLMPLGLAASQWEPLLPRLASQWCTIVLGGAELHPVALLEERAQSGYSDMVLRLLEAAGLREGQSVLEVGCGSGALVRALARKGQTVGITALDINPYLLREAAALSAREGVAGTIEFKEGSAEALPFGDSTFDLTFSSTVMEEVNADRTLDEMMRVTKPGGGLVAVVRAVDRPTWLNLPLRPELMAKIERQKGGGLGEKGCADASLYPRFVKAGLKDVQPYPQVVTVDIRHPWARSLEPIILGALDPQETQEWWQAVEQAVRGSLVPWVARPFHCAIARKPIV